MAQPLSDTGDPKAQPVWRVGQQVVKLIMPPEAEILQGRVGEAFRGLPGAVVPELVGSRDQAFVKATAPHPPWKAHPSPAYSMRWVGLDLHEERLSRYEQEAWFDWMVALARTMDAAGIDDTDVKPENFTFDRAKKTFHYIDLGGCSMVGHPPEKRVVSFHRHIECSRREAMQRARVIAAAYILGIDRYHVDHFYADESCKPC